MRKHMHLTAAPVRLARWEGVRAQLTWREEGNSSRDWMPAKCCHANSSRRNCDAQNIWKTVKPNLFVEFSKSKVDCCFYTDSVIRITAQFDE